MKDKPCKTSSNNDKLNENFAVKSTWKYKSACKVKKKKYLLRTTRSTFTPSVNINSEVYSILHMLYNIIRDKYTNVSHFCRIHNIKRHRLSNLFTGWVHNVTPIEKDIFGSLVELHA